MEKTTKIILIWIIFIILITIIGAVIFSSSPMTTKVFDNYERLPLLKEKIPLHLIYIPWDKDQKLKDDQYDFDHTFYNNIKNIPDIDVYLWTYDKLKTFSEEKQPGLWDKLWKIVDRPVQIVDFYRIFVVYHLGGIYWQYGSKNFVPFRDFVSRDKDCLLLTEAILFRGFAKMVGKKYEIREGKEEELLRIATQVFWAKKNNEFMKTLMEASLSRLEKYQIKQDYDILYIGGNAMISEVYDQYPRKDEIEVKSLKDTKKMVYFSSSGSWRKTDKIVYILENIRDFIQSVFLHFS